MIYTKFTSQVPYGAAEHENGPVICLIENCVYQEVSCLQSGLSVKRDPSVLVDCKQRFG